MRLHIFLFAGCYADDVATVPGRGAQPTNRTSAFSRTRVHSAVKKVDSGMPSQLNEVLFLQPAPAAQAAFVFGGPVVEISYRDIGSIQQSLQTCLPSCSAS